MKDRARRDRPRQVTYERIRGAAKGAIRDNERQRVVHGYVTAIDTSGDAVPPTTVQVGPAQVPAYANAGVEYEVGDKVSLSFNGRVYTILGRLDPEHAGAPMAGHVAHTTIATYIGDGTLTTMIFGGPSGNAVDPDGMPFTDPIPQTFEHLVLEGRLSHTDTVVTALAEARLRFNADTGTNYNYINWNSQGTTFAAAVETSQNRIYIAVGTTGAIRCYIPHYRAPSAITTFQVHAHGIRGTATAANYDQRAIGGRYEKGLGVALSEIRLFVTGGEFWSDTTHVTLYGMM